LQYKKNGYTLKVEGLNGIIFSETASLSLNRKRSSILIQTDKGMYKPRDKIQFRILVIDGDTKPYDLTNQIVEAYFVDPKNNRIKQWKNIEMKNGVFKDELKLSSEPTFGYWTLYFSYGTGKDKKVISCS
jgi:CD109 antigen